MIRISNSSIFKFGSIFLFAFFLFSYSTFAQEENVFLPPAPGTTASEEETNVYLQRDSAPAQNTQTETTSNVSAAGTRLSCPHVFTRDLELGMSGEDVRLLQTILNKDSSTAIATSGAGSAGKETGTYGESTKAAVMRLQEKAKEYIGTPNGRFGTRTRTIVTQMCSGSIANGSGINKIIPVQNQNTEPEGGTDKVAPRVSLSANFNSIQSGNTFKIIVNLSEPIKAFTPDAVIVDNGEVKEIRKLSKNSYAMTVVPKEGTKSVNVQIEAERIEDMAGNLNENASNEVLVKILIPPTNPNPNGPVVKDSVDSLIDKITSSTPDCKYDNNGDLITKNPITGEKLNANGCKMKDPSKQYAPFNTVLKCYADTGELPPGIQETQRCSNPQNPNSPNNPLNPNNPNSPCSPFNQQQYANQVQQIQRQSSAGGFSFGTVLPPNPCQNAQVVQATQQKMQQQRQQAQQAAQQQAQFQGLGQMLGNLLKTGAFGGGPGQNNNRNDGPDQRYQPPADEKTCDPNSQMPWNKCPEKKEEPAPEKKTEQSNVPCVLGIAGFDTNCDKKVELPECEDGTPTILAASKGCKPKVIETGRKEEPEKTKTDTQANNPSGKIIFDLPQNKCEKAAVFALRPRYEILPYKTSGTHLFGTDIDYFDSSKKSVVLINKNTKVVTKDEREITVEEAYTKKIKICRLGEHTKPKNTVYDCYKGLAYETYEIDVNFVDSSNKTAHLVECPQNQEEEKPAK